MHTVLVVDSNQAFAMMLKQGLEQDAEYRATIATDGAAALEALENGRIELAIVDMGLEDTDAAELVRDLRQRRPNLCLMVIPLQGTEVPDALSDMSVQGTLTKPFFLPELPERIEEALSRPVGESVAAESAPPADVEADEPAQDVETMAVETSIAETADVDWRGRIERWIPQIKQAMRELGQDANAEAVLLTHRGELAVYTGRLSEEGAQDLAEVVSQSWDTSARIAEILGREQLRFEQSMEGGEYLFYSLAVTEEMILSVASQYGVALGMIRHRSKETAETLRRLIG